MSKSKVLRELSKEKLNSYINSAESDVHTQELKGKIKKKAFFQSPQGDRWNKRKDGLARAHSKIGTPHYHPSIGKVKATEETMTKKTALQELSKEKLHSYINSSEADANIQGLKSKIKKKTWGGSRESNRWNKRTDGLSRAHNKIMDYRVKVKATEETNMTENTNVKRFLEPLTRFILSSIRDKQIVGDHPVELIADRNGNGDELFKGTSVKSARDTPQNSRMGYKPSEAEFDKTTTEEIEEDASRDTIKRYSDKDKSSFKDTIKKGDKKLQGDHKYNLIMKNRRKIGVKEENETVAEASFAKLDKYMKKVGQDFKDKKYVSTKKIVNRATGSSLAAAKVKGMKGVVAAKNPPVKEEVLDERLTATAKASTYIDDFVHSNDPKFAGKSKHERIRMGLGAYYAEHRKGKGHRKEAIMNEDQDYGYTPKIDSYNPEFHQKQWSRHAEQTSHYMGSISDMLAVHHGKMGLDNHKGLIHKDDAEHMKSIKRKAEDLHAELLSHMDHQNTRVADRHKQTKIQKAIKGAG